MVSYIGLKAEGMGFDAHLTVHYCGELHSKVEINRIKNIISTWDGESFECYPIGYSMFGPKNNIPVVRVAFKDTELLTLRLLLKMYKIPDPYEYEWNPHITLKLPRVKKIKIPPKIQLTALNLY